jgi:leader peptidase (prepilin peptidase)/N-methyltransferase
VLDEAILAVLVAPIVGSFLGVLIRRLPEGRLLHPARSACDHCGHVLGPLELVPLVSWLALRGRCRACGQPIGIFHPAVELAALLVAGFAWSVAPGDAGWVWATAGLGWILLALGWIDAEHRRLPDALTLPLIPAGLAVTLVLEPDALLDHAVAAVAGYAAFMALAATYRWWRGQDGLGEGDAKLLAAGGAWLGLEALPWTVCGAALIGLAMAALLRLRGKRMGRHTALPFGPPLAAAIWFVQVMAGVQEIHLWMAQGAGIFAP